MREALLFIIFYIQKQIDQEEEERTTTTLFGHTYIKLLIEKGSISSLLNAWWFCCQPLLDSASPFILVKIIKCKALNGSCSFAYTIKYEDLKLFDNQQKLFDNHVYFDHNWVYVWTDGSSTILH